VLLKFTMMLWEFILHAPGSKETDIILGVLSLIDVSLVGNLIVIAVFSSYENFVSRIDPRGHPDWPDWMTKVDFDGLKQKVLASLLARLQHLPDAAKLFRALVEHEQRAFGDAEIGAVKV